MGTFFHLILSLSIAGTFLSAILFFLNPLIKTRVAKAVSYSLWLIVLARFLLPFSVGSYILKQPLLEHSLTFQTVSTEITRLNQETQQLIEFSHNNTFVINHAAFPVQDIVFSVWLMGFLVSFCFQVFTYIRFQQLLKKTNLPADSAEQALLNTLAGRRRNIRLFRNVRCHSPVVSGLIRPRIMLPDMDYTPEQLKNVLRHEIIHLKRFDLIVKWLCVFAASLHWFNPLIYLVRNRISHACELACDEAVISQLSSRQKQSYGEMLLYFASPKHYPSDGVSTAFSEESKRLKERLISIMKYRKKSKLILWLSMLLILLSAFSAAALGPAIHLSNSPQLAKPLDGKITQGFGSHVSSKTGKTINHPGLDIAPADGSTEIYSVLDGTIIEASNSKEYGNYVVISHSNGDTSFYGDCNTLTVQKGQQVLKGQTIAEVGSSGATSTGPHLHFEYRQDGIPIDPTKLFE